MKKIQKEKVIPPQPEKKIIETVYVASDGKEFRFLSECARYEKQLEVQNHPVFKSKIAGVDTFFDGYSAALYYLRSQEDYEFLCAHTEMRFLEANHWEDGFGPGWYLFYTIDGGDYADDHYLYKLDEYERCIKRQLELWHARIQGKIAEHRE